MWDGTWSLIGSAFRGGISIHPSRVGWDEKRFDHHIGQIIFQSTHPVWDGTRLWQARRKTRSDFNPPIPCGMGQRGKRATIGRVKFQSTHPVWDGTVLPRWLPIKSQISIHPSRVGWDSKKYMITYISCDSYPFCQIFRLHKMTAYSYS